jgi:hypothetical protein
LLLIVTVADLAPAAPGVNVTVKVQVAPGATVAPVQPFDPSAKSLALAPLSETVDTVRLAVPSLVTVIVDGELGDPTVTVPNDTLPGVTEMPGAVAVPESDTVLFPALVTTVTVPDFEPAEVGVNVIWNVQVEPDGIVAPVQLSDDFTNSAALVPLIVTLDTVRSDVPLLVSVTVTGDEDEPTITVPWLTLVGEMVPAGVPPPVPDSATVGLPALVVTVTVAERAPSAPGVNDTLKVQLDPAATLVPEQLSSDFVKSAEFVPLIATLVTDSAAVPVFDTVTVCAALVAPTVTVPKLMLVGETLTAGVPPPLPDSATVGLPALLDTVTVADREPSADGVNVRANVQLDPAGTLAPVQLSDDFEKSPGLLPPMETLEMDSAAVPVLLTVTVCAELLCPTVMVP